MAGQMLEESKALEMSPALQKQLGLENVTKAISELMQYSRGVLPADARARLMEVAAYMKRTSPKAENYNTAWFGEQAMKALSRDRLDIAVFAVSIGMGGGMSLLGEKDRKIVEGIVTMESLPQQKTLATLIIRTEIAATEAFVETLKKDFGPGVAGRVEAAAKAAKARYDKGDVDGAERLIGMARGYTGLVLANQGTGWAGCDKMEAALELETAGKDGLGKFNASVEDYRMELARQQIRERLQFLGDAIERMRKLMTSMDEQGRLLLGARIVGYEARLGELRTRLETINGREELDAKEAVRPQKIGGELRLGPIMPMSFRERYAALFSDLEMESQIYRFSSVITEQAGINRYDRVRAGGDRAILPYIEKADKGFAQAQLLLQQGKMEEAKKAYLLAVDAKAEGLAVYSAGERMNPALRLVNAQEFQLPKLGLFRKLHADLVGLITGDMALDPELRLQQIKETERAITIINTTMIGVKPNVSFTDRQDAVLGLVGQNRLDEAEARMRRTLQIAGDYSLWVKGVQDAFTMAMGIGAFFIPVVGPGMSTGIFGLMAYEEGAKEYRTTGTVSPQTMFFGALSLIPAVGAYGRGVKMVKTGAEIAGGLGLGVGAYGVAGLYMAAANEEDPVRRHELLSNAIYGTVFLAPAAIGVAPRARGAMRKVPEYAGKGYRFARNVMANLDYAFQDLLPMPEFAMAGGARGAPRPMTIKIVRPEKPGTAMMAEAQKPAAGGAQQATVTMTTEQLQQIVRPPKPPNWVGQKIKGVAEWIGKSRERVAKMAPPSAQEVGASSGRVVAEMMNSAPENMVEVARQVYRTANETGNKQCWAVLRRLYANDKVRAQLEAVAQNDKEMLLLMRATEKNVTTATAGGSVTPKTFLSGLSAETTATGVPPNEMLAVISALERRGARVTVQAGAMKQGARPQAGTELAAEWDIAVAELREGGARNMTWDMVRARVLENNSLLAQTERTVFGGNRLTATDRATLTLNLEAEGGIVRVKAGKKAAAVEVVPADRVLQDAQAANARVQAQVDAIPVSEKYPFTKPFKDGLKVEYPKGEPLDKMLVEVLKKQEVQAQMKAAGTDLERLNAALGSSDLEGALAAMPKDIGTWVSKNFGPASQFADDVLAARTLGPRSGEIENTVRNAADLFARGKRITIREAFGDTFAKAGKAARYVYWGSVDAIRAPGVGNAWKTGTALAINAAAWYWTGSQAYDLGIKPLVGTLRDAESEAEGRKAVKERFMVDVSRENAIFVRSNAGAQFMDYIPALFPKGSERRPETQPQMLEALKRGDIVYDFSRIDSILSDGRALAATTEQINGLLGNEAGLRELLEGKADVQGRRAGGLGITVEQVNALLKKEGKAQIDITDLVDLMNRTDYWVSQGWAFRFGNMVMNTFCYDLGMDGGVLKENSAFLAANPDVFLALWNRFKNGNLPAVFMADAINAVRKYDLGALRQDPRTFEQGVIRILQENNLYLATPIAKNSFLAVLDERPYGMPDNRAVDRASQGEVRKVLNAYRNNPEALQAFNKFAITADEDIYGNVSSLATIIATNRDAAKSLRAARSEGYVAPGILGVMDPSILGRKDLVGFAVKHSSQDSSGGATMEFGVCKWALDNKDSIKNLTAILTDLSTKEMAVRLDAIRMYTPKEGKSFLILQQKSVYEPNGWYVEGVGAAEAKKEPGLVARGVRQAGKPFGMFQEKKVVMPEGFGGPTAEEQELAEREKELAPHRPHGTRFESEEAREGVVLQPALSAEAEAWYANVGKPLKALLEEMGIEENKVYWRAYSDFGNPIRAKALNQLNNSIAVTVSDGKVVEIKIDDREKAKTWLNKYISSI